MKIFNYPAITSTNDYAKEHLNDYDKVIVIATHQWLGRGRNQHHWEGDYAKNVYLSYGILHPLPIDINTASVYQAFGGLVAYHALNAIEGIAGSEILSIKYPNDILARDNGLLKKIGGVLVEHSFLGNSCYSSVIGIGVNVLQETFSSEVANPATSLKLLGIKAKVNEVTDKIIKLIEYYDNIALDSIKNEWIDLLNINGKKIRIKEKDGLWIVDGFSSDLRIIASGVDSNEKLILSNGDSVIYPV